MHVYALGTGYQAIVYACKECMHTVGVPARVCRF